MSLTSRGVLLVLGTALVLVGVHLPATAWSLGGSGISASHWQDATGDSAIICAVLVTALVLGAFGMRRACRALSVVGAGLAVLAFLVEALSSSGMEAYSAVMTESLAWGWAVIVGGSILVFAAWLLPRGGSSDGMEEEARHA